MTEIDFEVRDMNIRGDARAVPLRDGCVQSVVTSPPYFGLRDYGDSQQIGLEATPDAYVATLVAVFAEVRRVLKDDGTVWLNLGDSYAGGKQGRDDLREFAHSGGIGNSKRPQDGQKCAGTVATSRPVPFGSKPKDLIGIPWRVAFALQADGWYLRSDIIWHKPNPMPESVTDRPTKSHEYLFLLAKSARYYYDANAIREPLSDYYASQIDDEHEAATRKRPHDVNLSKARRLAGASDRSTRADRLGLVNVCGRNKRSVWTIPTMPYSGAHFATFPEALVEPCILAGCPLGGLVFDPFIGSGTVGAVAERLGRRWVGTDLSYQPLSVKRTAQRGLRFDPV